MCFDMSEMFVSSLWKKDFDKLFTACVVLKRGSQLNCAHNRLKLVARLRPELTGQTRLHAFLLCFFLLPLCKPTGSTLDLKR